MKPKYVGLDVRQSSAVVAVYDARGKSRMECVLATEAEAMQDFQKGLGGPIHVTFEEAGSMVTLDPLGWSASGRSHPVCHPLAAKSWRTKNNRPNLFEPHTSP